MIYHICRIATEYYPCFNVVHYLSFRIIMALLTALSLSWIFGNWFIRTSKLFFKAPLRPYVMQHHTAEKHNMPTMGGIFMVIVVLLTSLLWSDLTNASVLLCLLTIISFAAIGGWDDWHKIVHKKGISAYCKSGLQIISALIIAWLLIVWFHIDQTIAVPFFKNMIVPIGLWYIPWAMLVLIASSNAVNITDGLDGLAIGSLIPNFVTFAGICYVAGHMHIAHYLHIPFAYSGELAVLAGAFIGVSLGFLWYNAHPAQIFMGDVGSLSLGAALGYVALISKQELLLPVAGGLFVIETLSVIIQVLSYKMFHVRVFKMAPLHHHFELMGWPESKISIRFIIISIVLCLIASITLKIR